MEDGERKKNKEGSREEILFCNFQIEPVRFQTVSQTVVFIEKRHWLKSRSNKENIK